MMTDAEKAALRTLQDDLFRARTELSFERRLIDHARDHLRVAQEFFTLPNDDPTKFRRIANAVDSAMAALNKEMT